MYVYPLLFCPSLRSPQYPQTPGCWVEAPHHHESNSSSPGVLALATQSPGGAVGGITATGGVARTTPREDRPLWEAAEEPGETVGGTEPGQVVENRRRSLDFQPKSLDNLESHRWGNQRSQGALLSPGPDLLMSLGRRA